MTSWTIPNRSILVRLTDEINDSLERHFWRWASLFLVLFLVCLIARDLRDKMWLDEFFTLCVAKQAGPAEIVKAIAEGCDGAPPLYSMIVHSILPIVKHEALAVRLPATLGYCVMIVCLLAFCRRRLPAAYSFFATLLAVEACLYFSTEGRSYGIVLGCAAGALLCWQTAAEGRRRGLAITLLALSLAVMVAMHYYAIFFLIPLFVAEMVRVKVSGKVDFSILGAMAPALLVLGLHYPLIAASKPFHAHFWSTAEFAMIGSYYRNLSHHLVYVFPLALVVLAVFPKSLPRQNAQKADMPVHEYVAIGALTLMPVVVIAVSKYTTHVFVDRYVLWAAIGFALLLGTLISKAVRCQAAVGVTLLGALMALIAIEEIVPLYRMPVLREGEAVLHELELIPDGKEPIVVANSQVFMELSYYAPPRIRERLIYPVSRDLDLRYLNYDTIALLMSALSHRTKLQIKEYDAILAEYPHFFLASTPSPSDYLSWHLVAAGYRVVPVRAVTPPLLFEVEAPKKE